MTIASDKSHVPCSLLINAHIPTAQPGVTALAILNGRIVALGTNDQVISVADSLQHAGLVSTPPRYDLHGTTVWPGLTDSHIHFLWLGQSLRDVQLEGARSARDAANRVAERAASLPAGSWIRGQGWNRNAWGEGWPTRHLLDELVPHHPVALTSKDYHTLWANTLALHMAGITARTASPDGGDIVRDLDGNPLGILKENATALLYRALPTPSLADCTAALRAAQALAHSLGLTSIHAFEGADALQAFQVLEERQELRLRVLISLPSASLDAALTVGARSGTGSDWLRIGGIKIFLDGTLGSQTAAMLDPFEGQDRDNKGMLIHAPEAFHDMVTRAGRAGLSCAVHAIGDRANQLALDTYAYLHREGIHPPLPQRIEHAQIIHPADMQRFAALNVIASMQPIHATSDRDVADTYWGARARTAYAWNTLRQAGTTLAFGSDAPIESCNPFWGLYAALTRQRHTHQESSWYPAERLSFAAALAAYTTGAAVASGTTQRRGQIAVGMDADLIVLPASMRPATDPASLIEARPLCTIVNGEIVYGDL